MVLFPNTLKKIGWLLVAAGLVLLVAYFTIDFRVSLPVFAIVSVYFDTKLFAFFHTNVADELIMICLLSGLLVVAFSREKEENSRIARIREQAMLRAALYNGLFLLFVTLFFYGQAFIAALLVNMCSLFVVYIVIFSYLKNRLTSQ